MAWGRHGKATVRKTERINKAIREAVDKGLPQDYVPKMRAHLQGLPDDQPSTVRREGGATVATFTEGGQLAFEISRWLKFAAKFSEDIIPERRSKDILKGKPLGQRDLDKKRRIEAALKELEMAGKVDPSELRPFDEDICPSLLDKLMSLDDISLSETLNDHGQPRKATKLDVALHALHQRTPNRQFAEVAMDRRRMPRIKQFAEQHATELRTLGTSAEAFIKTYEKATPAQRHALLRDLGVEV
jgi:hypothetical protein